MAAKFRDGDRINQKPAQAAYEKAQVKPQAVLAPSERKKEKPSPHFVEVTKDIIADRRD